MNEATNTTSTVVGSRRRWLWTIGVVVVLAVGAGAGLLIADPWDRDETAARDTDVTTDEECVGSDDLTGITEPETYVDDALVITESGIDNANTNKFDRWKFGAIVENTADLVAYHVTVTFNAEDNTGEPIIIWNREVEEWGPWSSQITIPYLLPGQKIGVGDFELAGNPVPPDRKLTLRVNATAEEFWQQANDVHDFGELTITRPEEYLGTVEEAYFDVTSPFCKDVPIIVGVIFRDSTGNIIGGIVKSAVVGTDTHGQFMSYETIPHGLTEKLSPHIQWDLVVGKGDDVTEADYQAAAARAEIYAFVGDPTTQPLPRTPLTSFPMVSPSEEWTAV